MKFTRVRKPGVVPPLMLITWLCVLWTSTSLFAKQPNLIWIMADDLGYGELGCYGQQVMSTPNIDKMASEGLKFEKFYAGATVCAPSRSVLMTGLHHGHTRVRGNAGRNNPLAQALREEDTTVAETLKTAGYKTALVGKWGLGNVGEAESGLPRKKGFDYFFGYLSQVHAHDHYPTYLWRNEERIPLPNKGVVIGDQGAGYATERLAYADELFAQDALRYVEENKDGPFFLYWSMVIPHANNEQKGALKDGTEVPSLGEYADKDWPAQDKGHAAMVTTMDQYVGQLLAKLQELNIADNTLVIFTSDNGPHNESNHDLTRFQPSGPLNGTKRALTDGGIRVPMIAWWPGKIAANTTSSHVAYFGDWFATAAELANAPVPSGLDSISFVPALFANPSQQQHEFLYWEFHEGGFRQAALYQGRWKGIRNGGPDAPIRLFDLMNDIGEKSNVANANPAIVETVSNYLKTARSENLDWPARWKK